MAFPPETRGPVAVASLVCEKRLVGTLHLANRMLFGGSVGSRSHGGKAAPYLGRGAMRLNGSLCGNAAPCCMQRLTGPGRPFGGERRGGPQAFSENLPDLSG